MITTRQLSSAMEMWGRGMSSKHIAARLGISQHTLWNYMRRHREQFPRRNRSAEWWREHLPDVDGLSSRKAADVLGSSYVTVHRWRKRFEEVG